ncbi:addiction module protein [bacterium]|nr:addiction module protein [bacterium]MBU1959391.1 addiction module protein [bacterium]
MKPLDKLQLIEKILNSLNQPNKTMEEIWANEAEERIEAYDKGLISVVNEEDVFGKYKRK